MSTERKRLKILVKKLILSGKDRKLFAALMVHTNKCPTSILTHLNRDKQGFLMQLNNLEFIANYINNMPNPDKDELKYQLNVPEEKFVTAFDIVEPFKN